MMSRGDEKAKQWRIWRPRFSVRTLVIFVTLVCAYFGAWELTDRGIDSNPEVFRVFSPTGTPLHSRYEPPDFSAYSWNKIDFVYVVNVDTPAPFIIARDEYLSDHHKLLTDPRRRSFYVWLFGPKIRLPFESTFNWDESE